MKNVIIMGRPRSGKSTLATMLADRYNYQIIRTDAIRNSFRDVFPEMNIKAHTAIKSEKFQKFVKHFFDYSVKSARNNNFKFVLEGCEITPKDCKDLYANENLIYVLAQKDITPEEMASNIRKYDTAKDWTTKMTYEELLSYCEASINKAIKIEKECKELGLAFYDTSKNRKNVLEKIIEDININS